MMRKIICAGKIIGLLIFLVFASESVSAQTKTPKPPSEKDQYKAAAKREKQSAKADKKAKRAYYKMQSKDSRKNIRKTGRKSARNRKSKKEPFWERWF
jgi:hypothetical protein